jgi:hypothetical protein
MLFAFPVFHKIVVKVQVQSTYKVRLMKPLLGTPQKTVEYLLEAPGGHIVVTVGPVGKRLNHETWDESIFENLFHTLRVV